MPKFEKGNKHPKWKGNCAGYNAIHQWIIREIGNPKFCINCYKNTAKKYEWANISGKYKRDVNDYVRLCVVCHRKFDGSLTGENHQNSKLKSDDIKNIRMLYKKFGYYHSYRLSRIYKVSQFTIMQIIKRKTWQHI